MLATKVFLGGMSVNLINEAKGSSGDSPTSASWRTLQPLVDVNMALGYWQIFD